MQNQVTNELRLTFPLKPHKLCVAPLVIVPLDLTKNQIILIQFGIFHLFH